MLAEYITALIIPAAVTSVAKWIRLKSMADVACPTADLWSTPALAQKGVADAAMTQVEGPVRECYKAVAGRVAHDCHNVAPGLAASYTGLLLSLGLARLALVNGDEWFLVWLAFSVACTIMVVLMYRHDLHVQGVLTLAWDKRKQYFRPTFGSKAAAFRHYALLAAATVPGAMWVLLAWRFSQ